MLNQVLYFFELLGIAAFAASGAAVGITRRMDVFGVIVLGLCASFGGGILRDITLGINPPSIFRTPDYTLVACVVSVIIFLPKLRRALLKNAALYEFCLTLFDAIGLGIFVVSGVRTTYLTISDAPIALVVFIGTISGVGGGMLRDVLAGYLPQIFVRNFYAMACIIGSYICIALWEPFGELLSMIIGAVSIIVIRMLAWKFHWGLPNAISDKEAQKI